jgi:hypothetical protein
MKFPRTNPKWPGWKRKASALVMILLVFAPYIVFAGSCMAQTIGADHSSSWNDPVNNQSPSTRSGSGTNKDSSDPAFETTPKSPYDHNLPSVPYKSGQTAFPPGHGDVTNLAQQAAEQNMDWKVTWDLTNPMGMGNDVYNGLHQWYTDDIFDNLFAGIGQLFGKWLYEFITGWMCDVIRFLTGALATFVLNPNIANNVAQGKDDISLSVHKMADIMMSIALDLLLLLFILCIWKYWAEANWRGMLNPMSSVMRLISTAGVLLAWPTIYSFVTELANQMIKAIWFNTADSMAEFDQAIVTIIKAGLVDTAAGLVSALAPVMGTVGTNVGFGGWVLGAVGGTVSFAAELIFGLLSAIIIGQLLVILMLKAVQTAILIAQYMFAPLFIVFFAVPDTEQFTVKYMYAFCMVSLWTFVWLALFRLLIIVLNSANNPWGKILLVMGVLQLMIQGPAFMASGYIDPKISFLDPKDIIDKVRGIPTAASGAVTSLWKGLAGGATPAPSSSTISAGASPAFTPYGANQPLAAGAAAGAGTGTANAAATSVNGQVLGLPGPKLLGLPNHGAQGASPTPGGPNPSPNPTGGPSAGGATFQTGNTGPTPTSPTGTPPTGGGPTLGGGPGGAAQTPPVKQAQTAFNAADIFGPKAKYKADLNGMVGDIADGDVGLAYGADGKEGYVFDSKSDLKQINIPQGASQEHIGRRIAVGASARLINSNDLAKHTAEHGSHKLGYDAPQAGDRQAAQIEGKDYKESTIGKFRAREGMQRYAIEGSEAYYRGEEGNDYTTMLRQMHGDWDGARQADTDSMMVNATRPDSPWNASYGTVTDNLSSLALKPTVQNRAAAGNPWIMSMNKGQQAKAVRAVSAYLQGHPSVAGLEGADLSSALGGLSNSLDAQDVDMITHVYVRSNGAELPVLNQDIKAGVQTLTSNGHIRQAGTAYQILGSYTGKSTVRSRIEAGVNFIQAARDAGMSEMQLQHKDMVEVGRLIDNFANNEPEVIPDLAVSAKVLGARETTINTAYTVNAMRAQNWDVNRINAQQIRAAETILNSNGLPTMSAVNAMLSNKGPRSRNP